MNWWNWPEESCAEKYGELDIEVLSGYTAGELKECLHKDTENAVLYWEERLRKEYAD